MSLFSSSYPYSSSSMRRDDRDLDLERDDRDRDLERDREKVRERMALAWGEMDLWRFLLLLLDEDCVCENLVRRCAAVDVDVEVVVYVDDRTAPVAFPSELRRWLCSSFSLFSFSSISSSVVCIGRSVLEWRE